MLINARKYINGRWQHVDLNTDIRSHRRDIAKAILDEIYLRESNPRFATFHLWIKYNYPKLEDISWDLWIA